MVKFNYTKTGTGQYMVGLAMNSVNYEHEVYCKMENRKDKDNILVFIKDILSQHVGISWLIHKK